MDRTNPYASPPLIKTLNRHRLGVRFVLVSFIAAVGTLTATTFTFLAGMGTALGSWPLSEPNFSYAVSNGAWWGSAGIVPVTVIIFVSGQNRSLIAAVICSLLWTAVTGFCFFAIVAMNANC